MVNKIRYIQLKCDNKVLKYYIVYCVHIIGRPSNLQALERFLYRLYSIFYIGFRIDIDTCNVKNFELFISIL